MTELKATTIVHSLLLFLTAGAIAFFTSGETLPAHVEPKILAAESVCNGIKLNYPKVIKEKINGKTVAFRYNCIRQNFWTISYDGKCPGCSGKTHFTDEPVRWGVCAVDPQVILPHSIFYVPGYGPCRAVDKGGTLRRKKIDLGFEDVRLGWWSARYTDIYSFVK